MHESAVEDKARRVASSGDGAISIEKRYGYCWDQTEQLVRVYLQPAESMENVNVEFHRNGFDITIHHEGRRYAMHVDSLFGAIEPERCRVNARQGGSHVVLRLAKDVSSCGEWPGLRHADGGSQCADIARSAVCALRGAS
mmetsp:Transcript_13288/g.19037  ORF Transcript_13288/g.19037 Transcript_13288/m.19037 type:complete len:140 (+) Transcript_13288:67-486(+)|eukprot:scaffold304638_cov36-Tisochrysis_lutea.AAC.1